MRVRVRLGLGLALGLEEGSATDAREVVFAIHAHHRDARPHVDEQEGKERLGPRHGHLVHGKHAVSTQ